MLGRVAAGGSALDVLVDLHTGEAYANAASEAKMANVLETILTWDSERGMERE